VSFLLVLVIAIGLMITHQPVVPLWSPIVRVRSK
jgi:hypothetical protein